MKSILTILALLLTTHAFAGVNSRSNVYSAEEIMRDIQSYKMTGKTSEELGMQVKNLMRTERVSKEEAIQMLKEFAEDMMKLKY